MKPTEILSGEHRIIEQVLASLEAIAREAKATGRLDPQPARDAVAFLRNFADCCHHGKEEAHLFPALEAKGFPREGGPTGVMLREHELGRAHVRAMDENIQPAADGETAALGRFLEHADAYVSLLREHIYKEDHVLFPLADRTLDESDQRALLAAFGKVEVGGDGPRHAREVCRDRPKALRAIRRDRHAAGSRPPIPLQPRAVG